MQLFLVTCLSFASQLSPFFLKHSTCLTLTFLMPKFNLHFAFLSLHFAFLSSSLRLPFAFPSPSLRLPFAFPSHSLRLSFAFPSPSFRFLLFTFNLPFAFSPSARLLITFRSPSLTIRLCSSFNQSSLDWVLLIHSIERSLNGFGFTIILFPLIEFRAVILALSFR